MGEDLWSRDHKLQKLSLFASVALVPKMPEDSRSGVERRPGPRQTQSGSVTSALRSSPPDRAQQWVSFGGC